MEEIIKKGQEEGDSIEIHPSSFFRTKKGGIFEMSQELDEKDLEKLMPHLKGVISMDVNVLWRRQGEVKQVVLEYKDGSKKIGDLNDPQFKLYPYNKLNSVVRYISRGIDGKASYKGNCCGQIIEQFITYVQSKVKDVFLIDPMKGSGTSEEVARRLGVPYWGNDLRYGFNALADEFPKSPNVIWTHPPYFVGRRKDGSLSSMPRYSGVQWGTSKDINPYDGSHIHDYEQYIIWLNQLNAKMYQQLRQGGYHGMLIGASKVEGKYYDPIVDMDIYGDLESIVIKQQTNCQSDNFRYLNNSFISIQHENMIIVRKPDNIIIPCRITRSREISIMQSKKFTWKALIVNIIEHLGGKATMQQLYEVLANHPKSQENVHYKEKIRQTLYANQAEFKCVERFTYSLTPIGKQLAAAV